MSVTVTRMIELAEALVDTPTLSVFISTESTRRRGGTHGVWCTEVTAFAESVRGRFAGGLARADREVFERNLRRLALRLRGLPHAVRAAGWLVIVARGDVHYCAPVSFAGKSEAHWQHGPWLTLLFAPTAIASHAAPFMPTARAP
jgi:hypothetical protein